MSRATVAPDKTRAARPAAYGWVVRPMAAGIAGHRVEPWLASFAADEPLRQRREAETSTLPQAGVLSWPQRGVLPVNMTHG